MQLGVDREIISFKWQLKNNYIRINLKKLVYLSRNKKANT